jgi:hypothetical protein
VPVTPEIKKRRTAVLPGFKSQIGIIIDKITVPEMKILMITIQKYDSIH